MSKTLVEKLIAKAENPPNLRDVDCCASCWYSDEDEGNWVCNKHSDCAVAPSFLCDSFMPILEALGVILKHEPTKIE